MITHCPFCLTHFRVRPEQLSVRAGQVRCGKCSRVFDASEHLMEEAAPARESAPAQERPAAGAPMAAQAIPELAPAKAMQTGAGKPEEAAIPEPPEAPSADVETPIEADAEADAFDFGPIAATADTTRRARRWPWILGSLLLLLVLLAQAAYYYRSALMVLFPQAKPYAAELCARLGCDLPLPRRIELMSIEASDLQADTANPNIMVLSATLKNRAVFNQQFPLLELTLTDAQDQPVVRRVLTPRDYAGKAADAQAGFAANTEIAIKVFIEASQVKATGYRLYLFYP